MSSGQTVSLETKSQTELSPLLHMLGSWSREAIQLIVPKSAIFDLVGKNMTLQ